MTRRKREKNLCFSEYSNNTTIHGFKYIGDKEKSLLERLCWLLILCASFAVCVYSIVNIWNRWSEFPVIVSFAQTPTTVWQIPFPAVTICPETQVRNTKYNYTNYYLKLIHGINLTKDELDNFGDVSEFCFYNPFTPDYEYIWHYTLNKTTFRSSMKLATPSDQLFEICEWGYNKEEMCGNFSPTITEFGLCYTFNMLDRSEMFTDAVDFIDPDHMKHRRATEDWSPDGYLGKTASNDTYPRRFAGYGILSSMYLLMSTLKEDLDYYCAGPPSGYFVYLHHPAEFIAIDFPIYYARHDSYTELIISPDVTTTSLRDKDPSIRKCFFSDERPLKFFRVYTNQNCYIECVANYTLHKCGCVPPHLPREKSWKICGRRKYACYNQARVDVAERESRTEVVENTKDSSESCNCLTSCTSVKYNAEKLELPRFQVDTTEKYGTALWIYYKSNKFTSIEKKELLGSSEFWANCGGLLGLFVGFSLISAVEVVYYFLVRLPFGFMKFRLNKLACNCKKWNSK